MIDSVSYLNSVRSATSETKSADSSKEMGKDAFMQLLINQMSHQDPMEPMDNSEFVSQLAQFSSLEQMQNVASSVQMLALSQAASTNSQMVSLIGKRVVVPGNQFSLDKASTQPVNLKFNLEGETMPTELIITDSTGKVVRKIDLKDMVKGENIVLFDGKDSGGNSLDSGNYSYKVVGADGKSIEGVTTYSNFLVDAVAFNGSDTQLKSMGAVINVKDITEVITN